MPPLSPVHAVKAQPQELPCDPLPQQQRQDRLNSRPPWQSVTSSIKAKQPAAGQPGYLSAAAGALQQTDHIWRTAPTACVASAPPKVSNQTHGSVTLQ